MVTSSSPSNNYNVSVQLIKKHLLTVLRPLIPSTCGFYQIQPILSHDFEFHEIVS